MSSSRKPSFKGQMLESITARMEREKKELAAAARERESRKGHNLAVTVCKP
jgi:hypothetical protein